MQTIRPGIQTTNNFAAPLGKDETLVCLIDERRIHPRLAYDISDAARRYGFTFWRHSDNILEPDHKAYRVRHLIVVDGLDDPEAVTRKHHDALARCTSATIAVSYSSHETFSRAATLVDDLKKRYPYINYLRPSQGDGGGYTPSRDKLIDNAICDSVRIKYIPHRKEPTIDVPENVARFFAGVSTKFSDLRLYHRASTDGFISLRASEDGSFYITATKTDKVRWSPERIVRVHHYDRPVNRLSYSGPFLPSSDSVEAATLYSRLPWISAIIHTHASELFTRNLRHRHRIAVPPSRYGEAELGDRLADFVEISGMRDFVIMADHGEMFFTSSANSADCLGEFGDTIDRESTHSGNVP